MSAFDELDERQPESGFDWLDAFLIAQGKLQAWLSFALGQAGAFFVVGREELPELLAQFQTNINDTGRAAAALIAVARDIHANALRNAR